MKQTSTNIKTPLFYIKSHKNFATSRPSREDQNTEIVEQARRATKFC